MPFGDDLRANLIHRLQEEKGDDVVKRVLARVRAQQDGQIEGEEVEEKYQIETF